MARLLHDLIEAAVGMDATSDLVALAPVQAQSLVNFQADRKGALRGQMTCANLSLSTFPAGIDGVGYLYAQNVIFPTAATSTTPLPARVVVASGGNVTSYALISPPTWPPSFDPASVVTGTGFVPGHRVRMAAFGQEMLLVQDSNGFANYRMQYGGAISQLGLNTPLAGALSYTLNSPTAGPVKKSGIVQYLMTTVDSLGRESSPLTTPLSVNYGPLDASSGMPTAMQVAKLHAVNPYTDSQVAGVNLYATTAGGSVFYQIASLVSPATDFEDNLPDATVSSGNPAPAFGENDKPRPASLIAVHKNRVILNQTGTANIQIGNAGSGTQFNSQGYRLDASGNIINAGDGIILPAGTDQGDTITGLLSFGSLLGIWKARGVYLLYGSDLVDFEIKPLHVKGCIAPDTLWRCDNVAVFLADDGVYALDGSLNVTKISKPIEAALAALRATPGGRAQMEAACAWFVSSEYNLAIGDTVYVHHFDTNQWTIRQF